MVIESPPENSLKRMVKPGLAFAAAYVLLTAVFYWGGPIFYRAFLPIWRLEIDGMPYYKVETAAIKTDALQRSLHFEIEAVKPIVKPNGQVIRTEVVYETGLLLGFLNGYFILTFSLLAAWPGLSRRQKLKSGALTLVLLLAACLIDVPIHTIGFFESWDVTHPQGQATILHPNRLFHYLALYGYWVLTHGGRQVLAIGIFALSILPHYMQRPPTIQKNIGRNAPCPCGSGRKYKHCCLKSE